MIHATYADRRNHIARHNITHKNPIRWLHSKLRDIVDSLIYERVLV
jgi:hypothetical protein